MKVLIATGQKELDQFLGELVQSPLPPVAYKEGVQTLCDRHKPDVVILSAFLDGNIKTKDLLYQLRKNGARVIVLIGHAEPDEIRRDWIPLGVYDYISDPVREEKIRFALQYPATLGMAEEKLKQIESGETEEETKEEPKPRKTLFKREKRQKRKGKQEPKNAESKQPVEGAQWFFETGENIRVPKQEKPVQTIPKPVMDTHDRRNEKQPKKPTWVFEVSEQESPIAEESKPKENIHAPFPKEQQKTSEKNHTEQPKKPTDEKQRTEITKDQRHKEKKQKTQQELSNKNQQSDKKQEDGKEQPTVNPVDRDKTQEKIKSVWDFQRPYGEPSFDLPEGFNIVILSPAPAGKTYIAMNLAATLSKQGAKTELVAFEGNDDIWQYFDLPIMEPGTPQGLPNLTVTPFKKMLRDSQYRIIDLPYDEWDQAKDWNDALFLYVTDMDVVHHRQAMRLREVWQGRKVLQVLNRFVSNVLDGGQEQKIRLNADIIFNDQPDHYLAMRFGRPVISTNQSAAREFVMAAKTVQGALPQSQQNNLYAVNWSS